MAAALRHGPSPMSKVAPAEGVVDNMHLTDRKRVGATAAAAHSLVPDGSEINLALMQLEQLAAEAHADEVEASPRMFESLGTQDFDPAELLAVLDRPPTEQEVALGLYPAGPSPFGDPGFGQAEDGQHHYPPAHAHRGGGRMPPK